MQSKAKTVTEYLAELPAERRAVIQALRKVINDNLGEGFAEGMQYGMIGYYVPHSVFPPGYHCDPEQPLPFAGLAAQKNAYGLYLFGLYQNEAELARFRKAWAASGNKLDMGKACVRFKSLDSVPLNVVGEAIGRVTVATYIAAYQAVTKPAQKPAKPRPTTAKSTPAKPESTKAKPGKAKQSAAKTRA